MDKGRQIKPRAPFQNVKVNFLVTIKTVTISSKWSLWEGDGSKFKNKDPLIELFYFKISIKEEERWKLQLSMSTLYEMAAH